MKLKFLLITSVQLILAQYLHAEEQTFRSECDLPREKILMVDSIISSCFPNAEKADACYLKGGLSTESILLKVDSQKYVVRINSSDSPQSLQRELYAMQEGAKANISPKIYYIASDNKTVVMEYIEGSTATIEQAKEMTNRIHLVEALRKVHATNPNPFHNSNYQTQTEKLYQAVGHSPTFREDAAEAIALFRANCEQLQNYPSPLVNTHGDLNPRNIFFTEKGVILIDWTGTSWDDPLIDLSYFAIFHNYDDVEEANLLELYLGYSPTAEEMARYELIRKNQFATLCLLGAYVHDSLLTDVSETDRGPIEDWSYYTKRFADLEDESDLAAFFYGAAKAALHRARE